MNRFTRFCCVAMVSWMVILTACTPAEPTTQRPTLSAPSTTLPTRSPAPLPSPPRLRIHPRPAPNSYPLHAIQRETPFQVQVAESEIRPMAPEHPPDLNRLTNPTALDYLSDEALAMLQLNGFVVVPAQDASIYDLYRQAAAQGLPAFLTTDVVLHTTHIIFNYALQAVEMDYLYEALVTLTERMLSNTLGQIPATRGAIRLAVEKNAAYFAVAARLIDPQFHLPERVRKMAEAELSLIEAQNALTTSPLFYTQEDYSQYAPRGHYQRDEALRRYFQTMTWYGRMPFRLRTDEPAQGYRETRQAILMTLILLDDPKALSAWKQIYESSHFLAGWADDLNFYDYSEILNRVFGDTLQLEDLNDDAMIDEFIREAVRHKSSSSLKRVGASSLYFRFMGQPSPPDQYIYRQTTHENVTNRLMPSGLDLLAVMGSERAHEIQKQTCQASQCSEYTRRVEDLRAEFAHLSDVQWSANLHWSWLRVLIPLLQPAGEGYPTFMRNRAWTDKCLHTALSSWVELQSDTRFQTQQSTTPTTPTGTSEIGYIEPYPHLYAQLAGLTKSLREGLMARDSLPTDAGDKLIELEMFLSRLSDIAEKELNNTELTSEEIDFLRDLDGELEALIAFRRVPALSLEGVQSSQPLAGYVGEQRVSVADLFKNPRGGKALKGAVGEAFKIYVLVPKGSEFILTQGGICAYYEFPWPASDDLTEATWRSMDRPDRPPWTKSFIAPK